MKGSVVTDIQPTLPALLTVAEVIGYLRLDVDGGDAAERLRNLVRRHGLPIIRRGRRQWFRRDAVDAWLEAGQRGGRMCRPARMAAVPKALQRVTSNGQSEN